MVASLFLPFSLLFLISTSLANEMVLEVEPANYQEITSLTLAPYEVLELEIAVQQVRGSLTQPNPNLHHSQYTLLLCKEQQPVSIFSRLNLHINCYLIRCKLHLIFKTHALTFKLTTASPSPSSLISTTQLPLLSSRSTAILMQRITPLHCKRNI